VTTLGTVIARTFTRRIERIAMPTTLPAQPWLHFKSGGESLKLKDQREFIILLSFALSPLAVLLVLFCLAGPEKMSGEWLCDEPGCMSQ